MYIHEAVPLDPHSFNALGGPGPFQAAHTHEARTGTKKGGVQF